MRWRGPAGKTLVVAAAGLALALCSAACGDTSPVGTVPEAPGGTASTVASEVRDDDSPMEAVLEAPGEAASTATSEIRDDDLPVESVPEAPGGMASTVSEAPDEDPPTEEAWIRGLLEEFVEGGQSLGVVAGVVRDGERIIVGHGRLSADDFGPPDGHSVFEVGSITKVFTSTVLADLVSRGELGLDTPVQSLLGDEARMPMQDGAEITLEHLATHSAGLPRLPGNLEPADWANPYADYTVERLYEFLAGHELARGIGKTVEYSNLGYGLLGHALALAEGTSYETLISQRILEPLEMSDTAVELTPLLQERLAPGHDEQLRPVPNWDLPALAGAGALRSTVNDLLIFLEANLGSRESPLQEAMELARTPRRSDPALGMDIGLGWIIATDGDREFVWHNGATGGYASFIGFDPTAGEGIVVLSNSAQLVDELAFRLFTRDLDG